MKAEAPKTGEGSALECEGTTSSFGSGAAEGRGPGTALAREGGAALEGAGKVASSGWGPAGGPRGGERLLKSPKRKGEREPEPAQPWRSAT